MKGEGDRDRRKGRGRVAFGCSSPSQDKGSVLFLAGVILSLQVPLAFTRKPGKTAAGHFKVQFDILSWNSHVLPVVY